MWINARTVPLTTHPTLIILSPPLYQGKQHSGKTCRICTDSGLLEIQRHPSHLSYGVPHDWSILIEEELRGERETPPAHQKSGWGCKQCLDTGDERCAKDCLARLSAGRRPLCLNCLIALIAMTGAESCQPTYVVLAGSYILHLDVYPASHARQRQMRISPKGFSFFSHGRRKWSVFEETLPKIDKPAQTLARGDPPSKRTTHDKVGLGKLA